MLIKALRNEQGGITGYEHSEFDEGKLVAESRSGSTQVFRHQDGRLFQLYHLKSGNIEATWVEQIPECLTVRYTEAETPA